MKTKRSTRNPSLPMEEAVSAMYTSMPWITAITAISVVVERIIPSSVRKLRSLLERSESKATEAASKKDAWDGFHVSERLFLRIRGSAEVCSKSRSTQSSTIPSSQKRGWRRAMNPTWPP